MSISIRLSRNRALLTAAMTAVLAGLPAAMAQGSQSAAWIRHTIDNSSLGADGVRAMDVNRDGLPDLVTGWEQGALTRVYLMQRRGQGGISWRQLDAGTTPDVEDAVFIDADNNGALDVVSATEGKSRRVMISWAPSLPGDYANSSRWETQSLFADRSQWMYALPMDVDGVRGQDLVIGGKNEGGKIGWLQSPSDPRAIASWQFHRLGDAGWIMSLMPEDMDRDGDLDILLSDRTGDLKGVRWLENPGKASPALSSPWRSHWVTNDLGEPMFIDTHDFDGDHIKEVVVPHYHGDDSGLSIFRSSDRQSWSETRVNYPANFGRAKGVAAGDINLDGRQDLVLSAELAEGRRGVVWLEYRESWDKPDWIAHDVSGLEGSKFDAILLADLDDDGDLDIVTTEENDNARDDSPGLGLVWYENPARK